MWQKKRTFCYSIEGAQNARLWCLVITQGTIIVNLIKFPSRAKWPTSCRKDVCWNLVNLSFYDHIFSVLSEASIHPEAMMHFPLFLIPPISEKNFTLRGKFSQFYLFQFQFSSAKISHDLFSHRLQIRIFPPFSLFQYIPHLFWKNYYFPLLCKCDPDFVKVTWFLHSLCVFVSLLLLPWCIYASHNARTGLPCVLVSCASVSRIQNIPDLKATALRPGILSYFELL